MKGILKSVLMLSVIAMIMPVYSGAQEEEEWQWIITPYFFLPSIDADSTIAGQTTYIDASLGDILDTFDVMSLSLRTEGWKGQWGFILDGTWTDMDGDFGPDDVVNVDVEQWYVDGLAGWRNLSDEGGMMPAWCDITAGLRYNSLRQSIGLPMASFGGTETWTDLMVGTRGVWALSDRWSLVVRGDIGGFDISDSADLSASATGGFSWLFTEAWSANLGYRYYYLDYETERSDGTFGFKGEEQGLWLGVSWRK